MFLDTNIIIYGNNKENNVYLFSEYCIKHNKKLYYSNENGFGLLNEGNPLRKCNITAIDYDFYLGGKLRIDEEKTKLEYESLLCLIGVFGHEDDGINIKGNDGIILLNLIFSNIEYGNNILISNDKRFINNSKNNLSKILTNQYFLESEKKFIDKLSKIIKELEFIYFEDYIKEIKGNS